MTNRPEAFLNSRLIDPKASKEDKHYFSMGTAEGVVLTVKDAKDLGVEDSGVFVSVKIDTYPERRPTLPEIYQVSEPILPGTRVCIGVMTEMQGDVQKDVYSVYAKPEPHQRTSK